MSTSRRIASRVSRLSDVGVPASLIIAALYALQGCTVLPFGQHRQTQATPATAAAQSQRAPVAAQADTGAAGADATQPPGDTRPASMSDGAAVEPRRIAHVGADTKRARDALVPSAVGYYMDVLQGRLIQDVGRDSRIERHGNSIVVLLPVGFDKGSARLNGAARQSLRPLAEALIEYRLTEVAVRLLGADSEAGGPGPGSRLASDRTGALSKYLTEAGVAGYRINTANEDFGQQPEDSALGPVIGARVELQVSPIVLDARNAF